MGSGTKTWIDNALGIMIFIFVIVVFFSFFSLAPDMTTVEAVDGTIKIMIAILVPLIVLALIIEMVQKALREK